MKIAHIADIHIPFAQRGDEYRLVFDRLIDDLQKEKPEIICGLGDYFHQKINLSPFSIHLAGKLFTDLSKIAPVYLIAGNHDSVLSITNSVHSDAVSPIVELLENGFIIPKDCKELPKPKSGNGIYFFKHSGFYDIGEIVFCVFSCLDNKILTLDEKDKDLKKKYIAMFHGQIYGSLTESGFKLKDEKLIKQSVFNNFDLTLLGDIHQFNSFNIRGVERMAYSSSLLQRGFGEDIYDHGYLLWDTNTCTYERKIIKNDYGYSKLNIYAGEIIEDRIQDLQFSADKKKTKVQIILEDFEENYSVEKLSQIEKFIKSRHHCEQVSVEFKPIYKEKELNLDGKEDFNINNSQAHEKLLIDFIIQNNYDNEEDVLELSKEIDVKLNYKPSLQQGLRIEFNKLDVQNLLSFPNEVTTFDFDKLKGLTLIQGLNYNGKSNVNRVITWVIYQKLLGGGEAPRLPNMYTGSNKAWARLYFTIGHVKYMIYRGVTVSTKKNGEFDVKYSVQYQYEKHSKDENGLPVVKWVDAESEEAATEKKEIKNMINGALGTYEDFTKISLQGGREDYLSLAQQPKNLLINKFLGLEIYADRHELANETFKDIKRAQKSLGDPVEIQKTIDDTNIKIAEDQKELDALTKNKQSNNDKIDTATKDILTLTKSLIKLEVVEEKNEDIVNKNIKTEQELVKTKEKTIPILEEWISKNFKKDLPENHETFNKEDIEAKINKDNKVLPIEEKEFSALELVVKESFKKEVKEPIKGEELLTKEQVEKQLVEERDLFNSDKKSYSDIDAWLKSNSKKVEKTDAEIAAYEKTIDDIRAELPQLNNELKISKGEKCPTCGNVSHKPNPEEEKRLKYLIAEKNKTLEENQQTVQTQKANVAHNAKYDKENNRLSTFKNNLQEKKLKIDQLKTKLEDLVNYEGILAHNKTYDNNKNKLEILRTSISNLKANIDKLTKDLVLASQVSEIITHNKAITDKEQELKNIRSEIDECNNKIKEFKENIVLLEKNKKSNKANIETNSKIEELNESIKEYKILNLGLENKIKELSGNIRVANNNIDEWAKKLNQIKEADRTYKKYSVYLQSVGRDGIPANIIKMKLPIINHKINSLLKNLVNFKVEIYMKPDGDIKEMFYFSDKKTDSLPMSMSSGAQKFITSVAISDGLHATNSEMVKFSFKAIDEGFDTLSLSKLMELEPTFSYLRNKYKNVFVITHRSEIKDFVDNVISVTKTQKGMAEECLPFLKDNPDAGISHFEMN